MKIKMKINSFYLILKMMMKKKMEIKLKINNYNKKTKKIKDQNLI